ncbi:uncharacterized protein LOC120354587 [Nilaparvata lugens]|uniref:uncharacterized protein LOC120354587 n=1 Tax=Nilaparvata lugens TaxID=108931 RepID=UPI00193E606E|nr:uncharacterized protein LOC120354587 [Nilaparvata lugens]
MPRERRLRGINSSAVRHRISFEDEDIDIESVLERTKTRVFEIIREHAARYDANVKWYIVLNVLLYKLVVLDDKVDESVSSLINLHSYSNIALNVLENYEDFNEAHSGKSLAFYTSLSNKPVHTTLSPQQNNVLAAS